MAGCKGDVLGLQTLINMRSCVQHQCCGIIVIPSIMMRFKTKIVDEMDLGEDGEVIPEEAIEAVLDCNETEDCFVGFLLRVIAAVENNMTILIGPLNKL